MYGVLWIQAASATTRKTHRRMKEINPNCPWKVLDINDFDLYEALETTLNRFGTLRL